MAGQHFVARQAEHRVTQALSTFRVVIVNGPRQAGKTTLLRLMRDRIGGTPRSLDDGETLQSALDDPRAFVDYGPRPLLIDEVQRGGDGLVRSIKRAVDEDPTKGQFVLSGSTRFLTVPTLSESLAGRAGIVELWPFSTAERFSGTNAFGEVIFDEPGRLLDSPRSGWSRDDYLNMICTGGFPEAVDLASAAARRAWHRSLLQTVTVRDVQLFARIQHAATLPDILGVIAARAGTPLIHADVGREVALSADTIRDYLAYLETVFLVATVPAWSSNLSTRFTKAPKTYVTDSGLAASLLNVSADALDIPGHPALGPLVETFVHSELRKIATTSSCESTLRQYRDRDGREIDFVLEAPDGRIVAIEVKASLSPPRDAPRHLRWLRDRLGDRFVAGIVLYLGQATYPRGDRIYLVPLSELWGHTSPRQS